MYDPFQQQLSAVRLKMMWAKSEEKQCHFTLLSTWDTAPYKGIPDFTPASSHLQTPAQPILISLAAPTSQGKTSITDK